MDTQFFELRPGIPIVYGKINDEAQYIKEQKN